MQTSRRGSILFQVVVGVLALAIFVGIVALCAKESPKPPGQVAAEKKAFDNARGQRLVDQVVYIFDARSQLCFACTVNKGEGLQEPSLVVLAGPIPYENVHHLLLNPPEIPPN